jgi:hypothetical protein
MMIIIMYLMIRKDDGGNSHNKLQWRVSHSPFSTLQFRHYNSNQRFHIVLLEPQYHYNTPPPTTVVLYYYDFITVVTLLLIKPTRWTNFSNLFWNETLHVSDSSSVHHKELFTVHTVMVYVIQVCRQPSSRIRMDHPDPAEGYLHTCMTYAIAVCTVNNSWWWTEELSETCRVSFQNKFEKLLHLVSFIKKICHDAQSHERKIVTFILTRFIRPFIMDAITNIL